MGLVATLFATPFTIRLLGPTSYGLWALLQVVLTYLVVADLGMAAASTKLAADCLAQGDPTGEATAIWTSVAITLAATSSAALLLGLSAPFLLGSMLHVPHRLMRPGVLAIRLLGIALLGQSLAGTINTPQVVRLRWRGLTLATTGPVIVQTLAVPLVLAAIAGGVVTMSVMAIAAASAAAVGNSFLAIRLQPTLRRPRFSRDLLKPLVRYGGALTLSSVAAIPLVTIDRLFLAHFRSTETVAYYAVAMSLGGLLAAIPVAATAPLFPALVRLTAADRGVELRSFFQQALQGIFLLFTPSAILLVFLAGPFLRLWAGPVYASHSTIPFFIIVGGLWFNALAHVPYSYLLAVGRTSTIAKIHLLELLPYLALTVILTSEFGLIGAASAWTIRVVVDSAAFFMVSYRASRLPWNPAPSRVLPATAASITLAIGAAFCTRWTHTFPDRAMTGCGLGLLYGAIMWTAVLRNTERQGIIRLVRETRAPRTIATPP